MTRRHFVASAAAATVSLARSATAQENVHFNVAEYDRANILAAATRALAEQPVTLTSLPSPVKALGANTYYSEDTEWWPKDDTSVFERRAGYTNPAAFCAHRDALVQMNGTVAACVAAWRLTGELRYATHAMQHLRAWFLMPATRMDPNLEHAATVPHSTEGTPHGVEDTVMLAETVRAASFLCTYNGIATDDEAAGLRKWCSDFATWLNDSKKGFIARESKDRLTVCWTLQAAECARFAKMGALQLECSHRFRDKLLRLMGLDGQFETELHRADPYASSIFTLDCLSTACELLSSPLDNFWEYTLPDGRGMRSAVAYLYPALDHRAVWKLPADVEHFKDWPVRQPALLFAGRAYSRPEYLATWKRLPPEPSQTALLRRFPVRQPALWTVRAPA